MSYVRFGEDGSDVYVFENVYGGVECCGCILPGQMSPRFDSLDGLLAHLAEHRAAGDTVPDHVEAELRGDDAAGRIDWRPRRMGPPLVLPMAETSEKRAQAADELTALTEDMGLYDEPGDRDGPRCTHCRRTAADHLAFGKCPIEVDGWRHTFTEADS